MIATTLINSMRVNPARFMPAWGRKPRATERASAGMPTCGADAACRNARAEPAVLSGG